VTVLAIQAVLSEPANLRPAPCMVPVAGCVTERYKQVLLRMQTWRIGHVQIFSRVLAPAWEAFSACMPFPSLAYRLQSVVAGDMLQVHGGRCIAELQEKQL
jgi:hypothetical protein